MNEEDIELLRQTEVALIIVRHETDLSHPATVKLLNFAVDGYLGDGHGFASSAQQREAAINDRDDSPRNEHVKFLPRRDWTPT